MAYITPVLKNESKNYKNIYRSVIILPLISKTFEKITNKQLSIYFEEILSKISVWFSQRSKYPIFSPFDVSKIDTGCWWEQSFGSASHWLLKAFDFISYNLLIAKLNPYELSTTTLKLVKSYLQNCKQRTKLGLPYRKNSFRCSIRIYFRTNFVQHIFMWFVYKHQKQLPSKLCWWYPSLCDWQQSWRSGIRT